MKIIVKNRRNNNEKYELTLEEFKAKFRNELTTAINSYTHQQEQKDLLKPPFMHLNTDYKHDFYQDLRWNFNNYAPTNYYIEKQI